MAERHRRYRSIAFEHGQAGETAHISTRLTLRAVVADCSPGGPRVLHVGNGWIDDMPGGLNRYVADLLRAADGRPWRAIVLGPARGAPPAVLAVSSPTAGLVRRVVAVWRRANGEAGGVDVVDAHFALYSLLPVLVGRLRRRALVVHFHGPMAAERVIQLGRVDIRSRVLRVLEAALYRRATRLIVLSVAFRDLLIDRYGVEPEKVEVVSPVVDLARFSPGDAGSARRVLGLPAGVPVAVVVRRLVPRMGVEHLVDAWAHVVERHPDAVLVVVGDGPSRAGLEARASKLGARVRFLGRVDDDAVVTAYRAADVAVVPSIALEGFGLVATESLACGTVVVASDVDGLRDAVGGLDTRLLVAPGQPKALARRLLEVFDERASFPDPIACRAFAERCSPAAFVAAHERIYREAAAP
jgi:glycosyltransferase involved in cell wall biosynthesis